MKEELKTGFNLSQQQNNNNTCSDRSRPITTAINPVKTIINNLIEKFGKGFLFGIGFSIGIATTTLLAVAVTGTIKTWSTGEVLSATDLNTTIFSLKTAIEGITSSQWTTSGSNISYTAGNVGIGTASPSEKLSLQGGQLWFQNTSAAVMGLGNNGILNYNSSTGILDLAASAGGQTKIIFSTSNGVAAAERVRIDEQGFVGLGRTATTHRLEVNGSAGLTSGTAWTNISDERLKNIKGNIPDALTSLEKLNPIQYKYNDKSDKIFKNADGKNRYGFTAQNVKSVFPEIVSSDEKGYLWYNPSGFEAILTSAIKELVGRDKNREKDFNQKFSKLEEENKKLQSELLSLRNSIVERDTFAMRLEERLKAIETMQMAKK
ncbi:MAG: tail fiber domain-containing protein [Leptospiraceae bacterium]|nr:tail fiber domain-containing protein [Leptospiraceae bacterium]